MLRGSLIGPTWTPARARSGPTDHSCAGRCGTPAISSAAEAYAATRASAVRSQENWAGVPAGADREQFAAGEDGAHRRRVVGGVVAGDEHAGDAVADRRPEATDGGRDDGRAAGLRLQCDEAEGLVVAGDDGDVGGAVVLGETVGRLGREERDDVGDAEGPGELLELLGGLEAGAAGGAHDVDAEAAAQPRVVGEQAGGGVQEDVGRLEGLDAADEEQHEGVLGHADRAPGGGAVTRGEPVEVDARRDDEGAGGVGAVVVDELARLFVGVGDEPVGLVDHLLLADHAGAGLGTVAVGQRLVLDLGEGVRRVDQRDAPPVAGQPADLAGEPVVRVDDVVVAGLVLGLLAQDGRGEGAQLGGEFLLAQALERAGADVADRDARAPSRRRAGSRWRWRG